MSKKNHPPFFSALCILTFIGSGTAFIAYFVAAISFDKLAPLIIKYSSWSSVDNISPFYFTILMALFCISLIGAIRMWKFHRSGFFIYSGAQVVILFFPTVWIGWTAFSMTNTVFTIVFIAGYLYNYKLLK